MRRWLGALAVGLLGTAAVQAAGQLSVPDYVARAVPAPLVVMTIGDSITFGTNSSDRQGYRSWLVDGLARRGYAAQIVNASAGGLTLDQIRPFIDNALAGGAVPDLIVINLGTNDFKWSDLNGWPERYRAEIKRLLDRFPGARALVGRPTLQLGYEGKFRNCNIWIERNTVGVDAAGLSDGHHLDGRAVTVAFDSIPSSVLTDGVHPGDAGYREMRDLIIGRAVQKGWLT
jgi:lysophospholipase L1-like esterase